MTFFSFSTHPSGPEGQVVSIPYSTKFASDASGMFGKDCDGYCCCCCEHLEGRPLCQFLHCVSIGPLSCSCLAATFKLFFTELPGVYPLSKATLIWFGSSAACLTCVTCGVCLSGCYCCLGDDGEKKRLLTERPAGRTTINRQPQRRSLEEGGPLPPINGSSPSKASSDSGMSSLKSSPHSGGGSSPSGVIPDSGTSSLESSPRSDGDPSSDTQRAANEKGSITGSCDNDWETESEEEEHSSPPSLEV